MSCLEGGVLCPKGMFGTLQFVLIVEVSSIQGPRIEGFHMNAARLNIMQWSCSQFSSKIMFIPGVHDHYGSHFVAFVMSRCTCARFISLLHWLRGQLHPGLTRSRSQASGVVWERDLARPRGDLLVVSCESSHSPSVSCIPPVRMRLPCLNSGNRADIVVKGSQTIEYSYITSTE